jgi:hypothetical protein
MVLCDHVKKAVPSSWDPPALARWVELSLYNLDKWWSYSQFPCQEKYYYPLNSCFYTFVSFWNYEYPALIYCQQGLA